MAKVSENEFIVVNGEKMTIKEWKKQVTEKQKERRGKKRFLKISKTPKNDKNVKEVSAVALEVEKMIKSMAALKSLQVYKNHAYRSWGTIANEIFSHVGIRKHLSTYCVKFGELNSLVSEIQEMSKKNEKAMYQYLDKVAWKLDDMKEEILETIKAVNNSGVCERFKDHEIIYGEGRQLGLRTVMTKALTTIGEIETVINGLKKIADNGIDPFKVAEHMSPRARARCWA